PDSPAAPRQAQCVPRAAPPPAPPVRPTRAGRPESRHWMLAGRSCSRALSFGRCQLVGLVDAAQGGPGPVGVPAAHPGGAPDRRQALLQPHQPSAANTIAATPLVEVTMAS